MLQVSLKDVVAGMVAACEPNHVTLDGAHAEYVSEGGLFRVRVYTHDPDIMGSSIALADIEGRANVEGNRIGGQLDRVHMGWDEAHNWRNGVDTLLASMASPLLADVSLHFSVRVEKEGI